MRSSAAHAKPRLTTGDNQRGKRAETAKISARNKTAEANQM
jgi:hypothetical protein